MKQYDYMIELLTQSPVVHHCFEMNRIRALIHEHLSRRASHNHTLWALMNLALWHRMYIEHNMVARPWALGGRSGMGKTASQ